MDHSITHTIWMYAYIHRHISVLTDGSFSLRLVPPTLLAAEKEEAKAVLNLFFKKQGLTNTAAARIINKSDLFVDHLISRLHSVHKSRYLVGLASPSFFTNSGDKHLVLLFLWK